jgi:hypothetical protein
LGDFPDGETLAAELLYPGADCRGEGFGATLDFLNEVRHAALAERGDPLVDGADGHLPGGCNFLLADAVAQIELDGDVSIMC